MRESEASAKTPTCPFCGSAATELMSLFGSSLLTSQYYCRGCRTAFEQVKWGAPAPDIGLAPGGLLPADEAGASRRLVPHRRDKRPATMKSKPRGV